MMCFYPRGFCFIPLQDNSNRILMSACPFDSRFIYYNSFSLSSSLKGVLRQSNIEKNYFSEKIGEEINSGTDKASISHRDLFQFFMSYLSFLMIRIASLFLVSLVKVMSLLSEDLELEFTSPLCSLDYYQIAPILLSFSMELVRERSSKTLTLSDILLDFF